MSSSATARKLARAERGRISRSPHRSLPATPIAGLAAFVVPAHPRSLEHRIMVHPCGQWQAGEAMTWSYSAKQHRWEATTHGWRAIAQRAPNGGDWEAATLALEGGTRIVSSVVYRSSDAAREWCEDAITRQRLGLG